MNIFGWIFFMSSWALIIALTVFCFIKVLSEKEEEL